jgi:hypothetical protein
MASDRGNISEATMASLLDQRLFSLQFWLDYPQEAKKCVLALASGSDTKSLSRLAQCFLKLAHSGLMSNPSNFENCSILVLGHALGDDAQPSHAMLGRLGVALEYYKLCAAPNRPRIILSGGRARAGILEADFMHRWLFDRGVSLNKLFIESSSMDTVENIKYSTQLLLKQAARNVLLVTSASHVRRASILLQAHIENLGLDMVVTQISYDDSQSVEPSPVYEDFQCFMDLGRLFGLWKFTPMLCDIREISVTC